MAGFWAGFGGTFAELYVQRKDQRFRREEGEANRDFQSTQAELDREFRSGEAELDRGFRASESALGRGLQRDLAMQDLHQRRLEGILSFAGQKRQAAAKAEEYGPSITWMKDRVEGAEGADTFIGDLASNPSMAPEVRKVIEEAESDLNRQMSPQDIMQAVTLLRTNDRVAGQSAGELGAFIAGMMDDDFIDSKEYADAITNMPGMGVADPNATFSINEGAFITDEEVSANITMHKNQVDVFSTIITAKAQEMADNLQQQGDTAGASEIFSLLENYDDEKNTPATRKLKSIIGPQVMYEMIQNPSGISLQGLSKNPFFMDIMKDVEPFLGYTLDQVQVETLDGEPVYLFELEQGQWFRDKNGDTARMVK